MAERKINLPETKGMFKASGLVTGAAKDNFLINKTTKTNKDMYILNFGLETAPESTVYISLNGMEKNEAIFYKKSEEKGKKGTTKKIPWGNRDKFKEEGYKLLGINVGVTKKLNDKGLEVNDTQMLTEYDACQMIAENLKDGDSVFVRGNIEFSSFKKDDGISRSTKFVPNQVSLCKPIDFEAEGFVPSTDFKQTIIFMEIEKDGTDKDDVKGKVLAKIVTYNTIEDAEFIIREQKLFSLFKKNLKPYTAINVWGHINNKVEKDEVVEDDCWGEENSFDKVGKKFIRELVITGADPKSIDKDTYSEGKMNEAVRALKEFGEGESSTSGDWGSSDNLEDGDNDGGWD